MRQPQPLRGGGEDDESATSPEGLLISAFLETGSFDPEKYHVQDSDIEAWSSLWKFCREYQAMSGQAPPMSLVRKWHPEFELTPDVNVNWAATKVREIGSMRGMRHSIRDALLALNDEDVEAAFGAFEGLSRPRGHRKEPVSVFDHSTVTQDFDHTKIEVPWPTLGRATGGIGLAELWYIAARLGQGKTWWLMRFAARAAKMGCRVGVHSLEMPAKQMAQRSHQLLAEGNPALLAQLRSDDVHEHKKALDHLAELTPGSIDILDPSHGRINTTQAVNESCHDFDLVIVDHVGLMMTSEGKRAIDDWRAMAVISNTLREITLASSTSVVGAAQINREGERAGSPNAPKTSHLSQSDALGQDADVVVTGKRLSARTAVMSAEKVRNGPSLQWYTRFDPEANLFGEISSDEQKDLAFDDEDRRLSFD